MKKKFLSVVALGLAFGFAFSAGCSKDPVDPPFNPADFSTAKTEDDIYTAINYGVDEFVKYEGAMTLTFDSTSGGTGEGGVKTESVGKMILSYDPVAKVAYATMESKRTRKQGDTTTTSEEKTVSKFFKVGEQNYMYTKESEKGYTDTEATVEEECVKVSQSFVDDMEKVLDILEYSPSYMKGMVQEQTPDCDFTTIKNAYNTVYAEQLETQKAKDANAKATASVTATNNAGVLEAKIVTSTETTDEIEEGLSGLMKNAMDQKLVAKDGKLSELSTSGSVEMTATVEGQTMTMSEAMSQSYKFTYSFDQAGYDAITATGMDTAENMPEDEESEKIEVKMTAVVGDWSMEFDRSYGDTEYKAENAFNSCVGGYFNYSNDYSVTWYTDKDCTTAVDWTDKKVDYLKDKTFYGKMTIEEGKAVVLKEITWKDSRSEAYKIVFGETGGYSYISNVQGLTVDTDVANNKHEFEDRDDFSDFLVIYVNGVAQAETATDFTYEAGKMYIVSYCNEYTDSKMNIFKMY